MSTGCLARKRQALPTAPAVREPIPTRVVLGASVFSNLIGFGIGSAQFSAAIATGEVILILAVTPIALITSAVLALWFTGVFLDLVGRFKNPERPSDEP